MKQTLPLSLILAVLLGITFFLGRMSSDAQVAAQGRGPVRPAPAPTEPAVAPPLVYESGGGATSASNGILAVTGSYGVGQSVLYVIDTRLKQLAVYEARGGSDSMRRLIWVGSRRIDRDLEVLGYNDESQYSQQELDQLFLKQKKGSSSQRLSVPPAPEPQNADAAGRIKVQTGQKQN